MARLDRQKPPSKLHHRSSPRVASRGYRVAPHPNWGDIPRGVLNSKFIVDYEIADAPTRTVVFKTNECSLHPATWDFGDGTPIINVQSYDKIYHSYAKAGTYTMVTTCHGEQASAAVTVVGDPTGAPTLTGTSPSAIRTNTTFTMTLTGSGLGPGSVRCWDGNGQFTGQLYVPVSYSDTVVVFTAAATNWAIGTGGVDIYLDGSGPTNQLQFQIQA